MRNSLSIGVFLSSMAWAAVAAPAAPPGTEARAAAPEAASPVPPCRDQSAECLQRIADLYLQALRSHDGSKLPLAPGLRRTENALTNARGAAEVRESFARTQMIEAVRDTRYVIDPVRGEVVLFFLIDVDLKAKDADATTKAGSTEYKVAVAVPKGTYTVHEAERFKIERGMIDEIEIIAHVENGTGLGSGWPVARDPVVSGAKP